ncbi:unnamed protein product [Rotaria sp. Silwood1]|nr:unnamed protein product [Rotaria sp. Silwood1]CAF1325522.1 unnamed protein product [Rotaria sp. Silwood1]CAF3519540.1 unnamed protein product [Rotaria sp. Silwood1]CAF3545071.1 unnamed protein product [Rotaria sp. Silwood1]CAF3550573.1 unnamed protein product [Rotaria sp. Silwood1]
MILAANRIDNDGDKKDLFLWSVGDNTYNLLESLVSSQSLTSDATKFTDLIKLLDVLYDATKTIMTSTYDFYSCYQKSGQAFAEWKAQLCEKLRHCGFTTSALKNKPQDPALHDMYVIEIKSQKIRQALLKEQDPDLEITEKIIQLAERLEEGVLHFGNPINLADYTVAKLHSHQPKQYKQQQRNSFTKNEYKLCQTCEKACRQKKNENISTKHITTIYKVNFSNQPKQSITHSSTVSLKINDYDFTFELDTGTFNTIISMEDWYKIGSPIISPSNLQLKCHSGNFLKTKGECNV